MPISSGGGGGGGATTLLSSTTLGADGTFDVTGLSQAFTDLQLVVIARGTRAASFFDTLALRLNNDSTTANYSAQALEVNTGVVSGGSTNTGSVGYANIANTIPAASAAAGAFSTTECWIYGYTSTTWNKVIVALAYSDYHANTAREMDYLGATWLSTAAVTRVTLFGVVTANLLAGSQLRIYGRN